jgi:hypothetical protein
MFQTTLSVAISYSVSKSKSIDRVAPGPANLLSPPTHLLLTFSSSHSHLLLPSCSPPAHLLLIFCSPPAHLLLIS